VTQRYRRDIADRIPAATPASLNVKPRLYYLLHRSYGGKRVHHCALLAVLRLSHS
jgi:hypothetical protein